MRFLFMLLVMCLRVSAGPLVDVTICNTLTNNLTVTYTAGGSSVFSDIPAGQTVLIYASDEIGVVSPGANDVSVPLDSFEEHERVRVVVSGPLDPVTSDPVCTLVRQDVNYWIPFAAGMGMGFLWFGFGWGYRVSRKATDF